MTQPLQVNGVQELLEFFASKAAEPSADISTEGFRRVEERRHHCFARSLQVDSSIIADKGPFVSKKSRKKLSKPSISKEKI